VAALRGIPPVAEVPKAAEDTARGNFLTSNIVV
jgi:hypothetical protein